MKIQLNLYTNLDRFLLLKDEQELIHVLMMDIPIKILNRNYLKHQEEQIQQAKEIIFFINKINKFILLDNKMNLN
jgi:hypothetical protein